MRRKLTAGSLVTIACAAGVAAQTLTDIHRRTVYVSGLQPAASSARGVDYAGFLRSYLLLRLNASGRLRVSEDGEPPCSGAGAQQASAQSTTALAEDAAHPAWFRLAVSMQERRDANGSVFDLAVNYKASELSACHETPLLDDSPSFPPGDALAEIRLLSDTIADRLQQEATPKLGIFIAPVQVEGAKPASAQAATKIIGYAFSDAEDYHMSVVADPRKATWVVEATFRRESAAKIRSSITVRDPSGQPAYALPAETYSARTDDELTRAYLEAGHAIISEVTELQNRRTSGLSSDPAEVTPAMMVKRARQLLCLDAGHEKLCDPRPPVALSLLDSVPPGDQTRLDYLSVLGEALFANKEYARAAATFDRALEKEPAGDDRGRVALQERAGEAWYQNESYREAADRYSQELNYKRAHKAELPLSALQTSEYIALIRSLRKVGENAKALGAWTQAASEFGATADVIAELSATLDSITSDQLQGTIDRIAATPGVPPSLLASAWDRLGDYLGTQKRTEDAVRAFRKAYDLVAAAPNADDTAVCRAANRLGNGLQTENKYVEALKYHKIALARGEKIWNADDENRSILVGNVADVYLVLRQPANAQEILAPIAAALRAAHPVPVRTLVAILYKLGRCYHDERRYDLAEQTYASILQLETEGHGANSAEAADALAALARLFEDERLYDRSAEYYGRVQAIFANLGQACKAGMYANNIGVTWQFRGDYRKASTYFENAVSILEKCDPGDYGEAQCVTAENLANMSRTLGRSDEARRMAERSIALSENGSDSGDYAGALDTRGRVFEFQANYPAAWATIFSVALTIALHLGPELADDLIDVEARVPDLEEGCWDFLRNGLRGTPRPPRGRSCGGPCRRSRCPARRRPGWPPAA